VSEIMNRKEVIAMLKTIVRFIREDAAAGMFEYAILLGVGVAAAAGLGALLVPQVRQAIGRAANSLSATAGW
jgi:Flp pilus assembly pilin Flp